MKILVTGGAGYVGSILVPLLLEHGYEVVVLDNLMYNSGAGLFGCFYNKRFLFQEGDIRNTSLVTQLLRKTDLVIHLAAIVGYPACRKDEQQAYDVNVRGTDNLVTCLTPSQRIIYSSTGSNYGAVSGICTEETPLDPLSVYGKTKTEAEHIVLRHPQSVAYRFATAFGISPRLRLDLMINDFVYQALYAKNLIVYEKDFRRTFIHVRDMAEGIVFAIQQFDRMKQQVFNVGSEAMNLTKEQIAKAVQKKLEFYLHFADVGKDEDQRNYEVSYQKIHALGYKTKVSLDDGLDELIRGLRLVKLKNPLSNV